jgi:hypothetical protein
VPPWTTTSRETRNSARVSTTAPFRGAAVLACPIPPHGATTPSAGLSRRHAPVSPLSNLKPLRPADGGGAASGVPGRPSDRG